MRSLTRLLLATIAMAGVASTAVPEAEAQWRVTSKRDEMTDRMTHLVRRSGSPIMSRQGRVTPSLVVSCDGRDLEVYVSFGFVLDREGYSLSRVGATVRWDDAQATNELLSASSSGTAGFVQDPDEWIERMQAGSVLRVRVMEAFGGERTARFDLDGFVAATRGLACIQEVGTRREARAARAEEQRAIAAENERLFWARDSTMFMLHPCRSHEPAVIERLKAGRDPWVAAGAPSSDSAVSAATAQGLYYEEEHLDHKIRVITMNPSNGVSPLPSHFTRMPRTIVLEGIVGTNGRVDTLSVRVVQGSSRTATRDAACTVFLNAMFTPAGIRGQAVRAKWRQEFY